MSEKRYLSDRSVGFQYKAGRNTENASNTVIKDGSFLWVMIPQDSGMQKTYYLVCRSEDAGKSWEYMQEEYAVTAGIDDICSKDGFIFLTSGSGTEIKNIQVMTVKKFFLKSISCWRRERVQKLKKLILKRSR